MKKRDVLKHLYSLIVPYRGRFLMVAFITLLSTGADLVEPLIYREAVNDIAGLFVKNANDNAKRNAGVELETGSGPLEGFLHQQIHSARDPKQATPIPASKTHEKKPHGRTNHHSENPLRCEISRNS